MTLDDIIYDLKLLSYMLRNRVLDFDEAAKKIDKIAESTEVIRSEIIRSTFDNYKFVQNRCVTYINTTSGVPELKEIQKND